MSPDEAPVATGTATQNQLSKLFKVDKNRVAGLLGAAGIGPVGKRGTFPIFNIREAASALVEVGYDVEDRLRHMNQADIPPLLAKEFWNGQNARKKYELDSGDLWRTDDVLAMTSALMQQVQISLKLMLDNVERQSGLTPSQRATIKRISEGTVNGLRESIRERFAAWPAPQDNVSGEIPSSAMMAMGKMDLRGVVSVGQS